MRARFLARPRIAVAGFGCAGRTSLYQALFGPDAKTVTRMGPHDRFGMDLADGETLPEGRFAVDRVAESGLFDRQHVVIQAVDGFYGPTTGDAVLAELLRRSRTRIVTALTKADLYTAPERVELVGRTSRALAVPPEDIVFVSTRARIGTAELARRVAASLPADFVDAFCAVQVADPALTRRRQQRVIYGKATAAAATAATFGVQHVVPVELATMAWIADLAGRNLGREALITLAQDAGMKAGTWEWTFRGLLGGGPLLAFADTVALGEAVSAWVWGGRLAEGADVRAVYKGAYAQARDAWPQYESRVARLTGRLRRLEARKDGGEIEDDELGEELAALGERDDRRVQLATG
ncbi:MAG: hypothetical protein ACOZNI_35480 [Myxococcota bacterium]